MLGEEECDFCKEIRGHPMDASMRQASRHAFRNKLSLACDSGAVNLKAEQASQGYDASAE